MAKQHRIVLDANAGLSNIEISRCLPLDRPQVVLWRKRWIQHYPQLCRIQQEHPNDLEAAILQVLRDEPRSGHSPTFTAEQVVQIVAIACAHPKYCGRPISHWTPREIRDEALKRGIVPTISVTQVGRFLNEADLRLHHYQGWLNAKPDDLILFAEKTREVCRLNHWTSLLQTLGVHFISLDEMTGIQALERLLPTLPLKPVLREQREFEYIRHGSLSLIAGFDV